MNNILLPSLSEDGWVDDSSKIADLLFSYFFISDYSQTYCYKDKVSSLPWILQKCQGDMEKTSDLTREVLARLFSAYFTNVEAQVSVSNDINKPTEITLNIYVNFTDSDGKNYTLGKLLEVANLTINKIIAINNGV